MGLTWEESIVLSRGVFRLERIEVGPPTRGAHAQAVYDLLARCRSAHPAALWPDESIRTGFENAVDAAKMGEITFHDCGTRSLVVRDAGRIASRRSARSSGTAISS